MKLLAAVALALVLIVAVVACFAVSPGVPKTARSFSTPWTIYTIDSNGGSSPSLEIDSDDNLHVSYGQGGQVMYATNIGGSWNISKVADSWESKYNSLGLDSNGSAHISYFAYVYIGYATNSGGSWTNYLINPYPYFTGRFNSIGLDSKDKVHISYQGYCPYWDSLRYATNANGSWDAYTIIQSARAVAIDYMGVRTSLAVDSSDKIHIICNGHLEPMQGNAYFYATNANGSWNWSMIGGTYASWEYASTSIAIDSNDKVHICLNNKYRLDYATNTNGSWEFSTIDYATGPDPFGFDAVSLALDSNDKAHVSYHEVFTLTLKYATNADGSWEISTIDDYGFTPSLALDSADNVYVVYAGSGGIMYATNAEPVIPEFGAAGVVVVIIATVCIFVALRRTSFPSTKE